MSLLKVTKQGGEETVGSLRLQRTWSARPDHSPLAGLQANSPPQLLFFFLKSLPLLKSFQTDSHPLPIPLHCHTLCDAMVAFADPGARVLLWQLMRADFRLGSVTRSAAGGGICGLPLSIHSINAA